MSLRSALARSPIPSREAPVYFNRYPVLPKYSLPIRMAAALLFSFSTVLAAPFFLWGRIRDNLQPLHYSVIGLKLFLDSETVKGAVLPVEKRAKVDALYDEDVAFRNFHEVQDALLK